MFSRRNYMKKATSCITILFALLFVAADPSFAVNGINAAAYGTVGSIPLPPNVTVTHTPGSGIYDITFNPNPFTPSVGGPQGFDNAPTCVASAIQPLGVVCEVVVGYDGSGAWSASVSCDAEQFLPNIHACVQNGSGHLRIVTSSSQCRNSETHLSWQKIGGRVFTDADFNFICVQQ
jgi:hypothetical protein